MERSDHAVAAGSLTQAVADCASAECATMVNGAEQDGAARRCWIAIEAAGEKVVKRNAGNGNERRVVAEIKFRTRPGWRPG